MAMLFNSLARDTLRMNHCAALKTTVEHSTAGAGTAAEHVRLIVDEPADGAWNMAVDEVLLEDAVVSENHGSGYVCLRVYRWCEPTLSLGYFQPYEDRYTHRASADCPVVRRSSGGGAIVHDHELTYSLAVPPRHYLAQQPDSLYARVHETLARALRGLGVETQPAGSCKNSVDRTKRRMAPRPFLCFDRRSPFDLVQDDPAAGGRKIVGSAQRRRRGAVLQHGSVLLATSTAAPEVAGPLCEPSPDVGATLTADNLANRWWGELSREFCWEAAPARLSAAQKRRAQELTAGKYGRQEWTRRR